MLVPLLAFAAAQLFAAGTPAFDPRLHKKEIAGGTAQVLVLGTMHLSQLPHAVDPKLFGPLLDRLARFNPQIITVEGLSGEECETLLRFKPQHGGLAGVAPRHANAARSPAHDKLFLPCPHCGAPPREQCVDSSGKPLPSTYVHRARLTT